MFEMDLESLSTADLLESAAAHRAVAIRADARLLEHALIYADRFHPDTCPVRPGRRSSDGRERAVVLGGEGCPEIAEFAIAEFGVMLGVSPGVAANYLGQALALRHRFPLTWARVLAGEATPWKACRIVAECSKLSEEAAGLVDRRIAGLVDSITPYRLDKIVKAARLHADPDSARAEAAEQARERGVFVGRSNEHGTKTMYVKAAAGAVIRNNATLTAIADALKTFGDTRPVQQRRADAVGIIADPRFTEELLAQARHHRLNHPAPAPTDAHPTAPTAHPTAPTDEPASATADDAGRRVAAPAPQSARVSDHPTDRAADAATATVAATAAGTVTDGEKGRGWRGWDDDELMSDQTDDWAEPGPDEEADRDAPYPSAGNLPDPLDIPYGEPVRSFDPGLHIDPDDGEPLDAAARRAVHARLARIKHTAHAARTAHTGPAGTGCVDAGCVDTDRVDTHRANTSRGGGQVRPRQTEIYVHLTDHTLATGSGVLRAEGIGPLLAEQLAELVGHGPYTVKPVIDLNDAVSVDTYEIPDRIRERVTLTHPVELFPFGSQEAHRGMDLDHIQPYDPAGPPGQTGTANLAPLGRFGHRVKTHARGWKVRRLDAETLEWSTPHGFTFRVDSTGTHRVHAPRQAADPG
jgi:hypothetical protein